MQYLSYQDTYKERLDPGGSSEDDCITLLLSSIMSSDEKLTKANQEAVVAVVEEELNSTFSRIIDEEATALKREPWWSYIWVCFSNTFP
jgi:hypothetical protein